MENYARLKEFSLSNGAALFGTASIQEARGEFRLPESITARLDRGISIGVRLSDAVLETVTGAPSLLYFHHYRQANYFLDNLALRISAFIQERGFLALPVPASQVIDPQARQGHLSHIKIAVLAGLGRRGINNLLVNPLHGARVRLATVLTDFPAAEDSPLPRDGCAACRRCISLCPAGAIKENLEDFDREACFRKLEEFRRTPGIGHHVCGVCVKACPAGGGTG